MPCPREAAQALWGRREEARSAGNTVGVLPSAGSQWPWPRVSTDSSRPTPSSPGEPGSEAGWVETFLRRLWTQWPLQRPWGGGGSAGKAATQARAMQSG